MARTKRIWREWQHPRASNGRFARKGSPEWVKSAAEKFRHADEALKAGTHAPGMPGGQRRGISRGAKAERLFAAHDASRVTGLGRQPVQGPQRPPAARGATVADLKKGDYAQVHGVDQYGKPTTLKGYVQGTGGVRMGKGKSKRDALAVQMSDTPSGQGSNFRGTVYAEHGTAVQHLPEPKAAAGTSVKQDIRNEVRKLAPGGDFVGLAELRDSLGQRHSKQSVDTALREMLHDPSVRILPSANKKALKERDHAAALNIGGEDSHMIAIAPRGRIAPSAKRALTGRTGAVSLDQPQSARPREDVVSLDTPKMTDAEFEERYGRQARAIAARKAAQAAGVDTPRANGEAGGVSTTKSTPEPPAADKPGDLIPKRGTPAWNKAVGDIKIVGPGVPGRRMTQYLDRAPQPGDLVTANGLNRKGTVVRAVKRNRTDGFDVAWEGSPYTQHHPASHLNVVDVEAEIRHNQSRDANAADLEVGKPKPALERVSDAIAGQRNLPTTRGRVPAATKGDTMAREGRAIPGVDMGDPNRWNGDAVQRFRQRAEASHYQTTLTDAQQRELRDALGEFSRVPSWETARKDAAARKVQAVLDEDIANKANFAEHRKRIAEAAQAAGRVDGEEAAKAHVKALKKAHGIPGDAAIKQLPDGQRRLAESIIFDAKNAARTRAAAENNARGKVLLDAELGRTDLREHTRGQVQKLRNNINHMATPEGADKADAEVAAKVAVWKAARQAAAEGVTGDKGGFSYEVMPGDGLSREQADELTMLGRSDGHALADRAAAILRGESKKPAMQQVSDTIAEQRGLPVQSGTGRVPMFVDTKPEDIDTRYAKTAAAITKARAARAERAASETPTMEAIKSVPTQRTAYHEMSRSNLVALSQAAGLPVRGRTNDRLAEALHRHDQEQKAAKNHNPSGIGAPSSQHTQLPQSDGGMARQAKLNEGVTALRDKIAEQRTAEASAYRTFSQRMAGDMSESDRLAAHARSDELRRQAREREAEIARQVAERDANDTRSEREKLTEQLNTHRTVQDINMRRGQIDQQRAARIKAIENRLAELDTEDRKAKIKDLDIQKGDKVKNRIGEFEVVGKTSDGYLRVLRPDGKRGSVDPRHVEAVTKAPKAEAAREAAPEVKAPTTWIDKATGREVTNPGQVGIVRGDIVKADSEAGKAAIAAREARRGITVNKAHSTQREMRASELNASRDPKDNGAKIRALESGVVGSADLYKQRHAGPSGQRADTFVGKVRHTPSNPRGEFQITDRNGETVGWASRTVRNGEPAYSVHSEDANGGTRLEGWAGELSTAADVLVNGHHVARGSAHDAERVSKGSFEPNADRGKSVAQLDREALDREIRQTRQALDNPNLGPSMRANHERTLARLEAERRGEAPPEAPKVETDPKAAKIAAKEAELKAAEQRLQAAGDWRPSGSMRTKSFGVRVDANLRRGGEARRDVERLRRELEALKRPEAPKVATGPVNFDDIKPGGIIKRDGQYYRVVKVNAKSVKVEMPPGWDDLFKKDHKITEVHPPKADAAKAEAPKAATTRGRFARTLKVGQLDTRRDSSQNGGGSNTPTTTGANMAKVTKAQEPYTNGKRVEIKQTSFHKPGMPSEWYSGTVEDSRVQDNGLIEFRVKLDNPGPSGGGYSERVLVGPRGGNKSVRPLGTVDTGAELERMRREQQQAAAGAARKVAEDKANAGRALDRTGVVQLDESKLASAGDKFAAQEAAYAKALRADDLTGLSDAELHDALVETSRARRATKVHSAADALSARIAREQVRRHDKERLPAKMYAAKYPAGVADLKPKSWDDVQVGDTLTIRSGTTPRRFRVLGTEAVGSTGDNRRVTGYYVNANGTPNRTLNKFDTEGAPEGKGDSHLLHLRAVENVEKNTRGGNVTASDVSAPTARPGEPTLGVEETSKGRTTTITLPDGSTATRTSKTMAYTHAVVVTTNNRGVAKDLRASAQRHEEYVAALQKWMDEGADISKLEKRRTASLSMLDEKEGRSPYEYYLPGFGPVQHEQKRTRFGGGGSYLRDDHQYGIPDPADTKPLRYSEGGRTAYQEYGPEYRLEYHREQIVRNRAQADKLDKGPAEEYYVHRWSQSLNGAMAGANEVEQHVRNRRTQIVGVGGVAKVPTASEKAAAAEAKKATAAEERAAAAEARKVSDAEARAKRDQAFYDRTRKDVERAIADGRDPEGELKFTTEAGLRALAKAYGVKLPRLPRDSYGRSQPLDRENARKLIVAKLREDMQGKA